MLGFDPAPKRLSRVAMDEDTNPLLGAEQQTTQEQHKCGDSSLASPTESFPACKQAVLEPSSNDWSWFHDSDLCDTGSEDEGWFSSLESYEDNMEYDFLTAEDCAPTVDSSRKAPSVKKKSKAIPLMLNGDKESAVSNSTSSVPCGEELPSVVADTIHSFEIVTRERVQPNYGFDQPSLSETESRTVAKTLPGAQKLRETRESVAKSTAALQTTLGKAYPIAVIRQGATFASFLGRGAVRAGSNVAVAIKNSWNDGMVRSVRDNLAEAGDIICEGLAALPQPEDSMGTRHRRRLF